MWHNLSIEIDNRREPLNELTKVLDQLSQTNAIKGNAADAMKAYIGEVHMILIQTLGLILNNYQAALGDYVAGYLKEVDSAENFQLLKEDLDDHERKLSSHRSDFISFGNKLKAISDEAEDIIWLGGAGSKSISNVVNEMNAMKKTVSNLKEKWNNYDNSYRGFNQVQDLIAQTASLLNSTLSVPRGYSYSPGSFRKLMSKNFVDALIANNNYAQNPANQKAFQANWNKILKNYKVDQKRMDDIRKEANRHKGAWEVVFGVGAVVIGVVAIVATAGAATPLVAVAYTAGFSAIAYGTSNAFEGSQIMVTGADKAFNPLRDTIFQGNQSAYDTFGNVAVFVAGSVIPVGAALKAGEPVARAFIGGVSRTSVTTAVGVGTNFVVAPIATSLAKSAGIDPIWAKDFGILTGFATSVFAAGKVYKVSGAGTEVEEVSEDNNINKYSLYGEEHYEALKDIFGEGNVEWTSKTTISQSERLKISNWDFTPSDELYIKYKDVYNNELYYNQATGKINWPSNYGFLEEVSNEVMVNPSMILDRYGEPTGQFMANATDSYESRALAPHSENAKGLYNIFYLNEDNSRINIVSDATFNRALTIVYSYSILLNEFNKIYTQLLMSYPICKNYYNKLLRCYFNK